MRICLPAVGKLALAVSAATLSGFAPAAPDTANVTFTKDVAPILYNRCVECHRNGEIAPMSFLTYQEVRPWARSIKEKVLDRSMPPWLADPQHSQFENDRRLSQKEIDTLVGWVNAGAPKGLDEHMPALPRVTEGWTIGQPDVIFRMLEEFEVPADGVVPYKYMTIPTNFTEDKWIQALEIRPGNRAVVHHVIAFVQEPGAPLFSGRNRDPQAAENRDNIQRGRENFLGGIAPGDSADVFPTGTAKRIKAGSNIVLQMHYTTNGEAARDRTSIGFLFAREPVHKTVITGNASNARFVIPPGDSNHEVRSTTTFGEDVQLLSLMPHMHVRGKDFLYTAVYPDGRSQVLLRVPKYDFNWQLTYKFAQPVAIPKGTRIDCVAHFDNSTSNRYNPDPTKEVRWGDQTWEEMMIGWFTYTRDSEQVGATVSSASANP